MLTVLLSTILMTDTATIDQVQNLDEVFIVSESGQKHSAKGQAASIDEHLAELQGVNLVRRGAYAWEPVVNNMQSERLSITIDGMKIFYACTDKMDPITSYVESANLQRISLNSGLDGNPQATGNIGGSLDLRLRKAGFDSKPFSLAASAGHEWNGHVQVYGADAALSSHRAYSNFGISYRRAGNYTMGGGDEVKYSQFKKFNAFANAGLRLAENGILEGTAIFDRATDVGYPALNMDVSKAQAIITSLAYKHLFSSSSWETKAYYNHITHEMDDTERPDVAIHMDMPGRSWTAGLYSLYTLHTPSQDEMNRVQHSLSVNYDLYYNRLFADMTMYPGGAAPMYMVTWPDVGTLNTGLAVADNIHLADRHRVRLSGKVAWQQQRLNSEEGWQALGVFFPGLEKSYNQTTARLAGSYQYVLPNIQCSIGAGWGSRAPTPTEAYGYFLNNTFDRYDYIGNPHLKNESAVELNAALKWSLFNKRCSIGLDGNVFFFSNYIIGLFENRLSPMTIGAKGVKVYYNISHATVANVSLSADYLFLPSLRLSGKIAYSHGRDDDGDTLPLISPLSWQTELSYQHRKLEAQLTVKGNARQTSFGSKYGETPASAWAICNLSAGYRLTLNPHHTNASTEEATITNPTAEKNRMVLLFRLGIENLFDKQYATYADWNHIPQKGRNVYMNITFEL